MFMFNVPSYTLILFIHPYVSLYHNQYIGMMGCTLVQPKKIVCDDKNGEELVSLSMNKH